MAGAAADVAGIIDPSPASDIVGADISIARSDYWGAALSTVAERFTGREAINELFSFDVDALSTSTDLNLADFIDEEPTITLLQPDGSRRAWHGLCTDAAWLGANGGMARYRLNLQPALALLGLRRDSYIFQYKDARDLIDELLADDPQVRCRGQVYQEIRL